MNGLLVSELARRSGLPATTLRFYEQQGLLTPGRNGSGYRIYDDAAVERLGFIATAKRLGLALSEIRRLLQPWEYGVCRDVRAELGPLLDARISETDERIAELRTFVAGLEAAREHLGGIDREGPCDRSCSFLRDPTARPRLACSLGAGGRAERAVRWRAALAAVTARRRIEGGLRLELDRELADVAELAGLAEAEAECCPFLDLRLRFGPAPVLEVRAPAAAIASVEELFGGPA